MHYLNSIAKPESNLLINIPGIPLRNKKINFIKPQIRFKTNLLQYLRLLPLPLILLLLRTRMLKIFANKLKYTNK